MFRTPALAKRLKLTIPLLKKLPTQHDLFDQQLRSKPSRLKGADRPFYRTAIRQHHSPSQRVDEQPSHNIRDKLISPLCRKFAPEAFQTHTDPTARKFCSDIHATTASINLSSSPHRPIPLKSQPE